MPGSGPERADIVIVGEAPGGTERALGKPFVGKSGLVLNRALTEAGITRPEVYVTNTVLCHSEAKGSPPITAVKACQARLFEEVRRKSPRVVVVAGNTALRAFGIDEATGTRRGREEWLGVEQLRGAVHRHRLKRDLPRFPVADDWRDDGAYVLPTWHPAYVARTDDAYPDLVRDLVRAKELAAATPAQRRALPVVEVVVPDDPSEALEWLAKVARADTVACDIEATSKDVMTDELLTIAYAYRDGDALCAVVLRADLGRHPRVAAAVRGLHAAERPRTVWWNGKFDRKWFKHHLGITVRLDGDGMLAHYALDTRPAIHGLKERAQDDLGAHDYEAEIKSYVGRGSDVDYGRIPFEKLCQYTALDVGMTLLLTEQYEQRLRSTEPGLYKVYTDILLPLAETLSDMELTGVAIDAEALRALRGDFETLLDGYVARMRRAVGHPINPASYPQLVAAMYGPEVVVAHPTADKRTALGVPTLGLPLVLNEGRTPDTSGAACDKLLLSPHLSAAQEDFLRARRSHVADGQLYRTYVQKLPSALHEDGRVRANFNLHVTRTGRLSSSEPINLQNIPVRRPEGRRIKNAFIAGYFGGQRAVLFEVDLSQAELRVAAYLSRDPNLMAFYREGRDFHHEVALRLFGGDEQLARLLREYVKTLNFGIMYGAEADKVATLLNDAALAREIETGTPQPRWTRGEGMELHRAFWAQFPGFAVWAAQQRLLLRTQGCVVSPFGRKRRWSPVADWASAAREAVNTPIQSGAAEIVNIALPRVHHRIQEQWPRSAHLLLTVHDSIVGESIPEVVVAVARETIRIVEAVPREYGFDVPFVADAKVGERWGSLVALEKWEHPQ